MVTSDGGVAVSGTIPPFFGDACQQSLKFIESVSHVIILYFNLVQYIHVYVINTKTMNYSLGVFFKKWGFDVENKNRPYL